MLVSYLALSMGLQDSYLGKSYHIEDSKVFQTFIHVRDSKYKRIWDDSLMLPKSFDWVDRVNDLRPLCNANPNDPVMAYKYGLAVLYCSRTFEDDVAAEVMREAAYFMVRPQKLPADIEYTKVAYIHATWYYHLVRDDCSLRMLKAFPNDRLIRLSAGLMLGSSSTAKHRPIGYKVIKEEFDKHESMLTAYRLASVEFYEAWFTRDKAKAALALVRHDWAREKYPDGVDPQQEDYRRRILTDIINGVKNPGGYPSKAGGG